MGKSKTTKFKRPEFNSAGLPVKAVKEDEELGDPDCPAAEFLDKVGHFVNTQPLDLSVTLMVLWSMPPGGLVVLLDQGHIVNDQVYTTFYGGCRSKPFVFKRSPIHVVIKSKSIWL